MTREEAIKRFETLLLHVDTDCVMGMETTEAINMAIKALEQPEPCEDAVSRRAAIDAIYRCTDIYINNLPILIDKADAYEALDKLPSVTPKSRWIPCVDGNEPKANADCWISTNAKYVRRASYAPKANNQPNGFIVTEGGFGFYEYGKSAKAWMPYEELEPYREEGEK